MTPSKTIYADSTRRHDVNYVFDIAFAERESGELTLQLLLPAPSFKGEKFPLIVDVPGSGWSGADGHRHVPLMTDVCEAGYAVACISYRGTFRDNVRFPAAVEDLKEAIRFLRANADKYGIDSDRIGLFGDSSGGHTVIIAALTGDDKTFDVGRHKDESTSVRACAAFYAPNDFTNLVADRLAEGKRLRPGEGEFPFEGREMYADDFLIDPNEKLIRASAFNYIEKGKQIPPFLFLQGDDDPIIPMAQGLRFCDAVRDAGGRSEFVKIVGGGHGRGCLTREAMDIVVAFFNTYMK